MTWKQRPLTLEQAYYSLRDIKRRRRRRRREPENISIPNDIVEEILVRLPVISLIRFQLVSKYWKSLITSRDFGERYISHQKIKDPKLFFICSDLVGRSINGLIIKTMTTSEETMTASLEHGECLKFEEFRGFLEISESCDGLVCIFGMTIPVELMNAASGMSISLPLARIQRLHIDHPNPYLEVSLNPNPDPHPHPDPDRGEFYAFTRFGFGKDGVTGRYKLVWLYNKYPTPSSHSNKMTRCEVLDLEDKRWRFVTTRPLDHHHILVNQRPAFANGSFYWLSGNEEGYPTQQTKLIVFDIHTEMFQLLPTPPFITRDASPENMGLCNLEGRLCISELKRDDCKQEFWWSVNDNTTWEKIFTVDLRSTSTWFRGITSQPLTPLAILRGINKVILSLRDEDNLVAFDLDSDSTVYHLYFSGYYGLAVPYFPSLLLFHSLEKETHLYVD